MHRFVHLYDRTNKSQVTPRVLTVALEKDSESSEVHFGLSICKPTTFRFETGKSTEGRWSHAWEDKGDKYDRKKGNQIALGRLKAFKAGREVVSTRKQLSGMGTTPLFDSSAEAPKAPKTPLAGSVLLTECEDQLVAVLDWIVQNFPDGHIVRMAEAYVEHLLIERERTHLQALMLGSPEEREEGIRLLRKVLGIPADLSDLPITTVDGSDPGPFLETEAAE